MFFFGKNLKAKHKVALCLVMLEILLNCWLCTHLGTYCGVFRTHMGAYPWVEFLDGHTKFNFNITKIVLSCGILLKMLVICIFRKF